MHDKCSDKVYYENDEIKIYCGDYLEIMSHLDITFDCAIIDPPYCNIIGEMWDKQWATLEDYIAWIEKGIIQVKNKLKHNGSLYIFGDDKNIAYVQIMIDKYLTLLASLVWHKINNRKTTKKTRNYIPMTERILFYTPVLSPDENGNISLNNFNPLREYFRQYQEALGLSYQKIAKCMGHRKIERAFYWNNPQWNLPPEEVYNQLIKDLPPKNFCLRSYKSLKKEYNDLKRTFNGSIDLIDIITGPIISHSENLGHPTPKPLWLIKELIKASTNQNDLIVDPMAGGGTTLVAAQQEGRRAIGIEISEKYCEIAAKRLKQSNIFSYKPEKTTNNKKITKQLKLV